MAGIDNTTWRVIDGWQHAWQSILVIIQTRVGTRVMRRDFGSLVPDYIDRPGTQDRVVDVTLTLAEALQKWEPRFALISVGMTRAGADGVFEIVLVGRYYPRGHLGDFTEFEDDREARFRMTA